MAGIRSMVVTSRGSLHFPMVLVLTVLLVGGLGFWGVLRKWRWNVEIQLRLNRCVGETAQELRDNLEQVDLGNQTIRALRVSVRVAQGTGQIELVPPLLEAMQVAVTAQDLILASWRSRRILWAARGGCGRRGDWAPPLPDLNLSRGIPDLAGPQIVEWSGGNPNEFRIQAHHQPRAAAARVEAKRSSRFGPVAWKISWAVPTGSVLRCGQLPWTNIF